MKKRSHWHQEVKFPYLCTRQNVNTGMIACADCKYTARLEVPVQSIKTMADYA